LKEQDYGSMVKELHGWMMRILKSKWKRSIDKKKKLRKARILI
jgi:hypothetical protein